MRQEPRFHKPEVLGGALTWRNESNYIP